jgi:hypothetical protein
VEKEESKRGEGIDSKERRRSEEMSGGRRDGRRRKTRKWKEA